LDELQKKEQAKIDLLKEKDKPFEPELEDIVAERAEMVKNVWEHIAECKHLEKKGYGNTGNLGFEMSGGEDDPTVTELPEIDGDEGFRQLADNDADLDRTLDAVAEGVQVLGQMANELNREVNNQTEMLDQLETKVDNVNDKLENMNRRLKNAITSVRKGDRFIMDFIMLVIILALAGFIYNIVKNT